MFLMYVDESGDPGLTNSPTNYYILSGLVLHELRWRESLDQLISFRRRMQGAFGLRMREEIHAAKMIVNPGKLVRIKRNDRLSILRFFANELATMSHLSIINVVVDKSGKPNGYDPFIMAWKVLLQRFENTMSHRNFPGPTNPDERGIVFPDNTDNKKLTQLLRQMRRYNQVPNQPQFGLGARNLLLTNIIEDPNFRNSEHSFFIQAVDLTAYLLYQKLSPNSYFKRKGAKDYFDRLQPVLCKVASRNNSLGIVYL